MKSINIGTANVKFENVFIRVGEMVTPHILPTINLVVGGKVISRYEKHIDAGHPVVGPLVGQLIEAIEEAMIVECQREWLQIEAPKCDHSKSADFSGEVEGAS